MSEETKVIVYHLTAEQIEALILSAFNARDKTLESIFPEMQKTPKVITNEKMASIVAVAVVDEFNKIAIPVEGTA